ncbi:FAD-dependent oxidoreductase [Labrys neptuniae]
MTVSIARQGSIAVVSVDNPPVNALSRAVRQGLWHAVDELDADVSVSAVVLACSGRTFIAGADIGEFGRPPEPPHLPDVVSRIEQAGKPWIAAIHGSALGGGLEVALGCRARLASADAQLGLPEVTLGLIPGAGGTVRLPRLIGVPAAVEMITGGKPVPARKAMGLGLIDAVIDGDLLAGALAWAAKLTDQDPSPPLCERAATAPADGFWEEAGKALAPPARREEAPRRALAAIRNGVERDFDSAMAFERQTFLDLRGSPQARALRHVFLAERAAPRPPELKGIEPRAIASAAVIGGGTMGAGIAMALADAGLPVTLVERDQAALDRGLATLRGLHDAAVKRGRLSAQAAEQRLAGIGATTDYQALAATDLAIEAVFEDLAVKREVFARLGRYCRPDAILATNTSYLDPNAIARDLPEPSRFLGLHFFSPAQVMKLIEIVPTPKTAPDVLAAAFALARRLGKIPVRAGICNGFIGNRILKTVRAQAERLLLAGSSPAAIDGAMRAFGLPMGPFEAQDMGGLDIAAFQRKAAREQGETVFAPIAERLCEQGRLGQKSSAGWYDYQPGERRPQPSSLVVGLIGELATSSAAAAWPPERLAEAIVLPMVNEAAAILGEGIALRAADIDLVKIHGYGFPRWRGGPMQHTAERGLASVVQSLDALAGQGLAAPPSPFLRAAAEAGGFDQLRSEAMAPA